MKNLLSTPGSWIYTALIILVAITDTQAQTIKIMSYNIHHGVDRKGVNRLDDMARLIREIGADLVGLQEVDSVCRRSDKVDQMKRLAELTGMHYVFSRHFAYQGGAYGLGILSKYPISIVKTYPLKGDKRNKILLTAVVKLPNQKEVIMSTAHLSAFDSTSRYIQTNQVIELLGKDKNRPVLLTGDLNAEPHHDEIKLLKKVFKETDRFDLLTFPEGKQQKKIDYILIANSKFRVRNYQTLKYKFSDHLPIIAEIKLK